MSLFLLEVIGKKAGLVADVVGRGHPKIGAQLLLVARQDVVAGQPVDCLLQKNVIVDLL